MSGDADHDGPSLFDPVTGELRQEGVRAAREDGACSRCVGLQAQVEALRIDLGGSEREVRSLRRKVGSLEAEARERRRVAKERPVVLEVFDYWVKATGRNAKRVKLGEKREKALLSRVREGYDAAYLKQAVDGLVVGAYEDPRSGKRYDDVELMARDEVNVERFHGIAELAKNRRDDAPPPPEAPPWET